MNRIDRLLGIILLLQGRRVVTAEQIARHFETSTRTVYRDLSALSEIGVPIAAEAGVGYSLLKGYHLPPVMFSVEEASALFVGGEMVKEFTDSSLAAPMASALMKIRAILPPDQRDQAACILQHTAVFAPRRQGDQVDRKILLPVQRALARHHVLHLVYRGKGRAESTSRDVEPLGAVYYGNAWYLVAWCRLRADYRHFRLDRIEKLALRTETFPPRAGFSLRAHLEEAVRIEEKTLARIRFNLEAADRARNEFFAGLVEERVIGDRVEMDFMTFSLEWLAGWIFSFGAAAEAIAPMRLRELVKKDAKKVAQLYD